MTTKTTQTPAKHLSAASKRWMLAITETFELEDHHLRLLQGAAEAWDRAQEARAQVAKDGPYFQDRFGAIKAHPAIAVQRDAMVTFARLLRELSLDSAPDDSRPPRIRGTA